MPPARTQNSIASRTLNCAVQSCVASIKKGACQSPATAFA